VVYNGNYTLQNYLNSSCENLTDCTSTDSAESFDRPVWHIRVDGGVNQEDARAKLVIPFATDDDAHTKADFCTDRRIRETIDFIDNSDMWGEVLDIGERNCVGEALADYYVTDFDNTYICDFNYGIYAPQDQYDTVLCLECFEHVINALTFVESLRDKLRDGGTLYLSCPLRHPFNFSFNLHQHYHEPRKEVLFKLLAYRGFKIERTRTFRSIPFWKGLANGGGIFRTIPRVALQETIIIKAVKV